MGHREDLKVKSTDSCQQHLLFAGQEQSQCPHQTGRFAGLPFRSPAPMKKPGEGTQAATAEACGSPPDLSKPGKAPCYLRGPAGFTVTRADRGRQPGCTNEVRLPRRTSPSRWSREQGPRGPFELLHYVGLDTKFIVDGGMRWTRSPRIQPAGP